MEEFISVPVNNLKAQPPDLGLMSGQRRHMAPALPCILGIPTTLPKAEECLDSHTTTHTAWYGCSGHTGCNVWLYGWKEHVNDIDVACCTSSKRDPRSAAMQNAKKVTLALREHMRSSACMIQTRTSPSMAVRMNIRYNKP